MVLRDLCDDFGLAAREGTRYTDGFARSLRGVVLLLVAAATGAGVGAWAGQTLGSRAASTAVVVGFFAGVPVALLALVFAYGFFRTLIIRPTLWILPRRFFRIVGRLTRSPEEQAERIVTHALAVLAADPRSQPSGFIRQRRIQFLNAGQPIGNELVEVPPADLALLYCCWAREALTGWGRRSMMSLSDQYAHWQRAAELLLARGYTLSNEPIPAALFALLRGYKVGYHTQGWPHGRNPLDFPQG